MDLALGGARADCSPTHKIRHVLRSDHVEKLSTGGDTQFRKIEQKMTRDAKSVVNLERFVEMRVVDETFPANRSARLLEVHTHHEAQISREFGNSFFQLAGVLARGLGVVNGAGTDDYQQTMVFATKNVGDFGACAENRIRGFLRNGKLFFKENRRQDDLRPFDPQIICAMEHG